jgi:MFS family permease
VSVSRLDRPGAAPDSAGSGPTVPLRSGTGAALITATVLASAVTAVDANVIKVVVPAIGRSLHLGTAALQWTLTSYLLTVAALLLLAGALSDRFGRRRLLAVGLLVMLAPSGLCAAVPRAPENGCPPPVPVPADTVMTTTEES